MNVNTTIHMTDCRGLSSLQLQIPVQQLRIHQSISLRVKMMKKNSTTATAIWKPGTIILENSKDILFCVPPLVEKNDNTDAALSLTQQQQQRQQEVSRIATKSYWYQIIVKDFQWLRKGISSPNFQIEVVVNIDDDDNNASNNIIRTVAETEVDGSPLAIYQNNVNEGEEDNDSDDEL
mmetsp:Transcript_18409/g.19850  ORF Transcript_18409/g.19850 Transcript_18409/m.19850 type:complete len:178 (+) Transcript_18409:789-1322(+)